MTTAWDINPGCTPEEDGPAISGEPPNNERASMPETVLAEAA